jgi:hypothetical protein
LTVCHFIGIRPGQGANFARNADRLLTHLHRLILPDAATSLAQALIKMIHGGIFPQIEAVACMISAQVDDQPSSPFLPFPTGIPAEFKAVELRQRQEMKIVSMFAPQRLACHSSRVVKYYLAQSVLPQACFLPLIAVCVGQ